MLPISRISSIDYSTDVLTTAAAHGLSTGMAVGLRTDRRDNNTGKPGTLPTTDPQINVDDVYFARLPGITPIVTIEAQQGGLGDFVTNPVDTTGAKLILIALGGDAAVTLADSEGNAWTLRQSRASGAGGTLHLYECVNPITSANHTFTAGAGAVVIAGRAYGGSGVFDQKASAGTAGGSSIQPGSVTPSEDYELVFAVAQFEDADAGTYSVSDPLTERTQAGGVALAYGIIVADEIQTTAAARNPTFTGTSASGGAAIIATYKVAAAPTSTLTLHPTPTDADANTNAIDFQSAGNTTLYLWRLTVRERILRQIVANLRAGLPELGDANVQRFNGKENGPVALTGDVMPEAWVNVTAAGDDAMAGGGEDGEVPAGLTGKRMTLYVDVHLLAPAPGAMTLDEWGGAWMGRIEEIVHADAQVSETASGNVLGYEMLISEISYPDAPDDSDGGRDPVGTLIVEITYDHEEADPYKGRADLDW